MAGLIGKLQQYITKEFEPAAVKGIEEATVSLVAINGEKSKASFESAKDSSIVLLKSVIKEIQKQLCDMQEKALDQMVDDEKKENVPSGMHRCDGCKLMLHENEMNHPESENPTYLCAPCYGRGLYNAKW